jgi:AAA15 family ATPase/GTPase
MAMKNTISNLEIKNFKSIKDIKISCKRINVFIGEPNVGKSNILESLSLYVAEFSGYNSLFLKDYLRYEKLSNLFFDQDRKNVISVESNLGNVYMNYHLNSINQYDIIVTPPIEELNQILFPQNYSLHDRESSFYNQVVKHREQISQFSVQPFYSSITDGIFNNGKRSFGYESPFKRYIFKSLTEHTSHFPLFLNPPFGDNLYTILESNPVVYNEATHFFSKYGLDLLIDTENNKLDIQKRVGNRVYKIPYSLAADTLQRIIFHLAAIETNNNSVLIFEEPEAHAFPKYISLFADKAIESKSNQFFIGTHSQYLLTPFIEQCPPEEIAIFLCTYENYETKIKELSNIEIGNIMKRGIDLFYNFSALENE